MGEALVSPLLSLLKLSPPACMAVPPPILKSRAFHASCIPKRSAKLNNVVTKPNIE